MSSSSLAVQPVPLGFRPWVEPTDPVLRYRMWRLQQLPRRDDLYRQRLACLRMRYLPTISIVTPVFNTPVDLLDRMLRSVARQTYPHWQHCLVDDGSTTGWLPAYLERLARRDPRIRFLRRAANGGIVAASNSALSLATGEFISMLDHDDELDPQALYAVVERLNAEPDADVIYSDFDVVDRRGRHGPGWFLPDWSPELLLSLPFIAHLTVYRRSIVEQVGAWRAEYEGSQDYDLALRASRVTDRIVHLPQVLYHWRQWERSVASNPSAKPYAFVAAKRAVLDHVRERNTPASLDENAWLGFNTVQFAIDGDPLVSVVAVAPAAATAAPAAWLEQLATLIRQGGHERCEIVLVTSPKRPLDHGGGFPSSGIPVRTVACGSADDRAAAANAGAAGAQGDHLLFLTAPFTSGGDGWLAAMLGFSQQRAIGVVGAKIYADGALWHGGLLLPRAVPHLMDREYMLVNYSAVGGGCLLTRRDTFAAAGGFMADSTVGYPEIDYALRLRALGYRHVVPPHARLRCVGPPVEFRTPERQAVFGRVWGARQQVDPYYNVNFRQDDGTFTLDLKPYAGWLPPAPDQA
jgi:GT2 family glycosyltransferase